MLNSERTIHAEAMGLDLPAVVCCLQHVLGQRLVAVMAGVANAKGGRQVARAARAPHPDTERRLRQAYQVAKLLLQADSAETVRAWFAGMNPDLDDRPQATVLADEPGRVLQAARALLAHA